MGQLRRLRPITVRPDCWESGIGKRLLEPTMALFEAWAHSPVALFTFPQSPKHVALYQKFGFWPQTLTAVMSKPVSLRRSAGSGRAVLQPCFTRSVHRADGGDLPGPGSSAEILAISDQGLGETVLLPEGGFAACHLGKGSEAGAA